jgi:predicted TIM-barrel fold metal-dependent hydrolase
VSEAGYVPRVPSQVRGQVERVIIDAHGHVTAPAELYAYQSVLMASRGSNGRLTPSITDDRIESALEPHLAALKEVQTDLQLISPRPFWAGHYVKPERLVHWYTELTNDIIARQCNAHPDVFRGIAGLPQASGVRPTNCLDELERCIKELGFVGCQINPDPGEGDNQTPGLGDEWWYPLYERLVELDVPALIHAGGCQIPREPYTLHFINEASVAVISLLDSRVFEDFPTLKLVISHGGGAIPYQLGRFMSLRYRGLSESRTPFEEDLRRLYFDTCLYTRQALEYLVSVVGPDRCLFGTEKPGTGSGVDPNTGRAMDDLKPLIEGIAWLTDNQLEMIFEKNALKLYKLADLGDARDSR